MRRAGKLNLTRIVLAAFFLVAAVLPLIGMFSRLASPEARAVFGTEQFATACLNSIGVALTSTAISLAFALAMSWVLCRTNVRAKGVIAVVMTLPMLIPSLALGMGLVFLNALTELTTSSLLWSAGSETLGVVIYNYTSAGYTTSACALSTVVCVTILALVLLYRGVSAILRHKMGRNEQ